MADGPRERDGAYPADAPRAEAPPAEALPAEAPPVGNRTSQLADRFERALSLSRLVVIVPVIVLLLSAVASFAYGTEVFVRSVQSVVVSPQLTSHNLGFLLLAEGKPAEAIAHLEKALSLHPGDALTLRNLEKARAQLEK